MKTPKQIPGLLMWLDASDQATVNNGRVTNNENVYKFVDKASGVTLVNNNGVNGPTYKYSTIKGRNIIEFASYNTTTFNDISLKSLTASNIFPNFFSINFATFSMFCVYLPTTQVGTESNIISMWNSGRVDGISPWPGGLSEGGFPNRGIGLSNANGAGRYIEAMPFLLNFPYHNEYQGFSENVHVYSGEQPSSFGKVSMTSVRLQKNLKKVGFLSENSSSLEDTTLAIDSLNNPNVVIIAEDFNTGTLNSLGWNQQQSGGTSWDLTTAPYNNTGNFTNFSVNTPSSNFVILNSASGSWIGNTSLISPTFSTLGRSDITVNFRHVFRYKIGDIARLDYTIDGGTIWTSTTYSLTATSPSQSWNPAAVQVENVSVSLGSGASGKSGVRVRFFYTYNNSFYWAIDNFSVSGVENLLGVPRNGGSVGYYSDRFPGPVSNGYAVPPQLPTVNGGTNKGFKSRWNINNLSATNYFVLGGFWPKSASFGKSQTAPFQGQFCEFLMFDRFLSDSETNSIRLYLQNKWFFGKPPVVPTIPNFIITIDTTKGDGLSQFLIPVDSAKTYNYTVYWENKNNPTINQTLTNRNATSPAITFPSSGIYRIEISGQFPHYRTQFASDGQKLIGINNWGNIVWTSMNSAFSGCFNLSEYTAIDSPNLQNVTDISFAFRSCQSFNGNINNWDVSNVTNMAQLFFGCSIFNQDLNNWNTINVTSFSLMFRECYQFNGDISSWKTQNVTDMGSMFFSCIKFNGNVTAWDTSKVTIMAAMFYTCEVFDQNIGGWDVSNVINMSNMFQACIKFNQSLNSWNVTKVTSMDGMFLGCKLFNGNVTSWKTPLVVNMNSMFSGCTVFNQNLSNWCVTLIPSLPGNFLLAATSWVLPKPVWGTCPP